MTTCDIYNESGMWKVKIGKEIRWLIHPFGEICLYYFALNLFSKFFCTNKATKLCDLTNMYDRISTNSMIVFL